MHYWNQEEREANKQRFKTAPFDPRFPSTNQAKRCWLNYVDYYKCSKVQGAESSVCKEFEFVFKEICPPSWVPTNNNLAYIYSADILG